MFSNLIYSDKKTVIENVKYLYKNLMFNNKKFFRNENSRFWHISRGKTLIVSYLKKKIRGKHRVLQWKFLTRNIFDVDYMYGINDWNEKNRRIENVFIWFAKRNSDYARTRIVRGSHCREAVCWNAKINRWFIIEHAYCEKSTEKTTQIKISTFHQGRRWKLRKIYGHSERAFG